MDVATTTGAKISLEREDPISAISPALFRPMGVDGVYARTAIYEDVVERLA